MEPTRRPWLESFHVGEEITHERTRTITEEDVTKFCEITANPHPLHTDPDFAKTTRFGQRVVVGNHVEALALGLSVDDTSMGAIANLAMREVTFLKPTFIGDTIRARTTVLEVRESRTNPRQGIVTVKTVATNQRLEEVMTFERSFLMPRRPQAEG